MDLREAKAALKAAKLAQNTTAARRIEAQARLDEVTKEADEAHRAVEAAWRSEANAESHAQTLATVVKVLSWEDSERAELLGDAFDADGAPAWAVRRRATSKPGRFSRNRNRDRWLPEFIRARNFLRSITGATP